jgi:uncharacterized RDD family membrane protein YckC
MTQTDRLSSANILDRIIAALITFGVCLPYMWIATYVITIPLDYLPVTAGQLLIYGPPVIWCVVDGSVHRATFGMRRCRLRYALRGDSQPTLSRAAVRIVVGVMVLPLLPISLVLLRTNLRRSIADIICGTLVVEGSGPARGFDVKVIKL